MRRQKIETDPEAMAMYDELVRLCKIQGYATYDEIMTNLGIEKTTVNRKTLSILKECGYVKRGPQKYIKERGCSVMTWLVK